MYDHAYAKPTGKVRVAAKNKAVPHATTVTFDHYRRGQIIPDGFNTPIDGHPEVNLQVFRSIVVGDRLERPMLITAEHGSLMSFIIERPTPRLRLEYENLKKNDNLILAVANPGSSAWLLPSSIGTHVIEISEDEEGILPFTTFRLISDDPNRYFGYFGLREIVYE
jgi:hypothetical protein